MFLWILTILETLIDDENTVRKWAKLHFRDTASDFFKL